MVIEKSTDPAGFADLERNGWEQQIAGYDAGLGRVSRQTVQATLDAAEVRAGMRVLDLCCGPGMLAAAVTSWDIETADNGLGLIYGAVRTHANLNVPLPHGPDVFQFSTRERMGGALRESGFVDVRAVQFAQSWQVASGKELLDAVYEGTVRTRAVLAAQDSEAIGKIIAAVERPFAAARGPDGHFEVPFLAVIGSGAKP